jgi:hypothetical protein
MIVLLRHQRQQTLQMKRVRMTGIGGKRLLAAHLRIEMPAGLHMAKAGLIQLIRCARLSGSPAFAAIHQPVSA